MAKFQVNINADRCKGCELCTSVCPKHLISVGTVINSKGYFTMTIENMDGCVGCTSCALICPDGAISIYKQED